MSYEIIEKLKNEIKGSKTEDGFREIGVVIEWGDNIAKISGLTGALSQELLLIETTSGEVPALVFNLEENFIGAIILGEAVDLRVGDRVKKTGQVMSIPVGDEIIGRVIDPLGEPQDGKGVIYKDGAKPKKYLLEKIAPSVVMREAVLTPLHTGIKAIDAMIPIGRGQRELIIGDRQTGKTAIALDTIINQKNDTGRPPVICIYVSIGQKNSKVAQFVRTLEKHNALEYTVVVNAPASSPASLQYLAPFTGVAIGEYFMDQGRDVLVIYDDLSKHANAYRQLSLLFRRPPGREAYPGDVFYLHSRLLKRAVKLSDELGGGSLTALPIIETQASDVSAYIPTNVISITDGQIFLESDLFNSGVRPAINVGISVSRVGGNAQTKAMKKVAGKLRLDLSQFRDLEAFAQFGSELDPETQKTLNRGERLVEMLKQKEREPLEMADQVAAIYSGTGGFLDRVKTERVGEFLRDLRNRLHSEKAELLGRIAETGKLEEADEEELGAAIRDFVDDFGADFDEFGDPVEAGESDRVKSQKEPAAA